MKKLFIMRRLSILAISAAVLQFSACKKDPDNSDDGGKNNTTKEVKPYIKFNGGTFVCAKLDRLDLKKSNGDTVLTWVGTGSDDTMVFIYHTSNDMRAKVYDVDSIGFLGISKVNVSIRWGSNLGSPVLRIISGDYEIKRENGKYVSYLKNAVFVDTNNGQKRYSGVEFKVVWPTYP